MGLLYYVRRSSQIPQCFNCTPTEYNSDLFRKSIVRVPINQLVTKESATELEQTAAEMEQSQKEKDNESQEKSKDGSNEV